MLQLSSLQNSRVKNLGKLAKRRARDQQRVTLVEGIREISHALDAGIQPIEIYICPERLDGEAQALVKRMVAETPAPTYEVTAAVFEKIAYRGESGGLLLVIPYVDKPLTALPLSPEPFLVVIEGVEKPGNLGAILRTADAAGVDAVIVCAGATDLHNPNVVRASLGALFTLPVAEVTTTTLIAWLQTNGIQTVAADPAGMHYHTTVDFAGPVAIVMGSEAYGLSETWLAAADQRVKIPMRGAVDSLNLSAATAIMLYEVVRQRLGVSSV
ncbi:MAG: RNA methyltransferase [Caldilineaceae bacterium]